MTDRRKLIQDSLAAIERLQARLEASERAKHEPIAIVGIGCRYPGGIETPDALWRIVSNGTDAITEVPADRWNIDEYYDPRPKTPGKMVSRRGGFLSQIDRFDAHFFGISPREAKSMDPQQRLLLETSWEAMESAGLVVDRIAGNVGVFVGITASEYGNLVRSSAVDQTDVYLATGNALNAAAGRISFAFGFQGPCIAVDTACSSSLVAIHLACQSLRAGESDLALAGGVNVILSPETSVLFSQWGMLAADGNCKTFDAAADGYVRSDGCAIVALKRLSDALSADDPILAVIRGSAVNSDGRSSGLTVPNGLAQEALLNKALVDADLKASDIDYVEAHGTGTPLGDPIEVEAIGAVMCKNRPADQPLLIGSIKTNFGHAETAAGIAGLLKVVMALRNKAIPPHLHLSTPNPGIHWNNLPIKIPKTLTPWPSDERPRCAGVSSFGFSGINAHVIVEEAPLRTDTRPVETRPFIFPLSAQNDAALRELALRYSHFFVENPNALLADAVTTAASGRSHMVRRVALPVSSTQDLEQGLRAVASGQAYPGAVEGRGRVGQRPKVAFLYTGQGSQYPGMGRALYESEPVFRDALDRMAAAVECQIGRPLLDVMFGKDGDVATINQTAYTQPALFALEYALTELWRSWGITPSIVTGHSVGEYAAACAAGVFSPEQGIALIADRGRLMQQLPAGGAMAALFADESRVSAALENCKGRVCIAAVNGPNEVVVSGDAVMIDEVLRSFTAEGIVSRRLDVSHAFHSPLLDPMLSAFEKRARSVNYSRPQIPLVSNLTGMPFAADQSPNADYWRRHAREPVRFSACIDALRAGGETVLVEIGPHPTLTALVQRADTKKAWTCATSLRKGRDERREMLAGLAKLYASGAAVQWDAVNQGCGGRRLSMPTYPFQRERHWLDSKPSEQKQILKGHPLIGEGRGLAGTPGTFIWERSIDAGSLPWLSDHRVRNKVVVPTSAYIEMALAAARDIFGAPSFLLRDIEYIEPLILQDDAQRVLQATIFLESKENARLAIYSRPRNGGSLGLTDQPWTLHAKIKIAPIDAHQGSHSGLDSVKAAQEKCTSQLSVAEAYDLLAGKGRQWGSSFRGLKEVWIGNGEAVTCLCAPSSVVEDNTKYFLHPVIGSAGVQSLLTLLPGDSTGKDIVEEGIREFRFYQSPHGKALWTIAKLHPDNAHGRSAFAGNLQTYDESGKLVNEALDVRIASVEKASDSGIKDGYYTLTWQPQLLTELEAGHLEAGPWLIFADRNGLAEEIFSRRKSSGQRTILVRSGDEWSFDNDRAVIRADEPEDYKRLLATVSSAAAIIHLWSLDITAASAREPITEVLRAGAESILHLLQTLKSNLRAPRPKIWLVTRDAQSVVENDKCDAPWSASLWGLGRSLSAEHSDLWGGLVDLASAQPVDVTASQLIEQISINTAEDKVAFRDNRRYVPRLTRRPAGPAHVQEYKARPDSTYLITGGLGGIGLSVARWLVEHGARHLLLVDRTAVPPREAWSSLDPASASAHIVETITSLESLGADVETAAVDIAVDGELARYLDSRRTRGAPNIGGVFHAAGVLHVQAIATENPEALRKAVLGKMRGAYRLHQSFLKEPLDCFVLFSSIPALLNSPLLGSFAVGDAFLDALAYHRRSQGLTALSVDWGTWGEVGMAVDAGQVGSEHMPKGVRAISTVEGLDALTELLSAGDKHTAVLPIDWPTFARAYPAIATDPYFKPIISEFEQTESEASADRKLSQTIKLTEANSAAEIARYLTVKAAEVLDMAPELIDPSVPLSSYGLDSLMAIQLKNYIQADFGVVLPLMQLLHGTTTEQICPIILDAVQTAPNSLVPPNGESVEAWEEGSL